MIVECSRRPDGWIPVIGNEEEICEFLLKQNYLLENGYAVHGNSINQEIYALEKRLQKRISLEERMSIISRIRSLKNGEG